MPAQNDRRPPPRSPWIAVITSAITADSSPGDTGINDTTVSQTLRYLRASQTVIAEREGRVEDPDWLSWNDPLQPEPEKGWFA